MYIKGRKFVSSYDEIIWLEEEENKEKKENTSSKSEMEEKVEASYASLVKDEVNEDELVIEASFIEKVASALLEKARALGLIDNTVDEGKFVENTYLAALALVSNNAKTAAKGKYKFEKDPEKWEKFWKTLTGDREHKITACIKKLKRSRKDKIDNPEAFCNALAKFVGYK